MKKYHNIRVQVEGFKGLIMFNRPEVHNAFNASMIDEIRTAVKELNSATNLRVLIIRAEGESFSSGADLNYMKEQSNMPESENFKDSKKLAALFSEILRSEVPVITVAHGNVTGGANGIVAASDFSLATTTTKFKFSEVLLGLVPATIAPYVLNRIGYSKSLELMLTARSFDGIEAENIGLVNKSVEESEINENLDQIIRSFGKSGPQAVKNTKKLLIDLIDKKQIENMIDQTSRVIAGARASEEGKEGLNSFFEKRKANWVNEKI